MAITISNMIDIHSHILPLIDDGSKSMEESIHIINKLEKLGFSKVIATPHYMVSTRYHAANLEKNNLLTYLKDKVDIELCLGNEVFFDRDIVSHIQNGDIAPMNMKNYVLIELPINGKFNELNEIIFILQKSSYRVILAHPERYECLQNNYELIDDLIRRGVTLQVNFEAILGKYGKSAKKLALYLCKSKKLHFLATDIHREDSSFFKHFPKIQKKLIKLLGVDFFVLVTITNPQKVIDGVLIET